MIVFSGKSFEFEEGLIRFVGATLCGVTGDEKPSFGIANISVVDIERNSSKSRLFMAFTAFTIDAEEVRLA
ncbi:hypothetical protein ACIPL1_01315 [Pseudomonas sp. NPDC090202]|uniref:hypothetical protein n=1 Tax=unclassified Pseudomonas TaxID=196821 RepID=UPI0037F46325